MFKNKTYKKPTRIIDDKSEIIKYAEIYLTDNNYWVDMNSFIWYDMNYKDAPSSFIFSVVSGMKETGKYEVQRQQTTDYYIITKVPKKSLKERYWWVFIALGFTLSQCYEIYLKPFLQKSKQEKTTPKQESPKRSDTVASSDTASAK